MTEHLGKVVEGKAVELSEGGEELGEFAEVHRIKKVYKIACAKGKKGGKASVDEKKHDKKDIESVVLGTIALKGS